MDFDQIRQNIVGEGVAIQTPYGTRRLTYTDYAASGRAYGPIEDFIRDAVLPLYANTHTETTATGAQTSAFREAARDVIKTACRCTDEDAVIFTGNGVTGAIRTLLTCMGLVRSCRAESKTSGTGPVMFIGSFEHHSVEMQARESNCDVVTIKECAIDGIDLDDLQAQLARYGGRQLLGCFSAASNVTGRMTNCQAVAQVMHEAGGAVFFDCAAAGPYVDLDMTNADAMFLSMHKFVGGPGAPGVLLARRALLTNRVPAQPGGGTVHFVSPVRHSYLHDAEHREEGGTPNIVGSIRAGLAMQLKESIGAQAIVAHEQAFAASLIGALRGNAAVSILGDLDTPRLGTVSCLFSYTDSSSDTTKFLHHNFVVALLNDLFGVQARGGNSCAAPYAHRLLRLSDADEAALETYVDEGWHGVKPGWARLSFGWYDSHDTLAFVTLCLQFIAQYGYCFLNDYSFNPKSGSWTNSAGRPALVTLDNALDAVPTALPVLDESVRSSYLDQALALANAPHAVASFVPTSFENMRWFWLPGEIST